MTRAKARILLDVDGPCADFVQATLDVIHAKTGVRREPHEVTTWLMFDALGRLDLKDWFFNEAVIVPGFCRGIPLVAGSPAGVGALREFADVHFVTSPMHTETWVWERSEWLKEHFGVRTGDIVHTGAKHLVRGDFLIDDKLETLEIWAEHHPEGVALLWDMPYNRGTEILARASKFRRVFGWEHCVETAKRALDTRA